MHKPAQALKKPTEAMEKAYRGYSQSKLAEAVHEPLMAKFCHVFQFLQFQEAVSYADTWFALPKKEHLWKLVLQIHSI